jgi:hypothetical protein
VRIDHRMTVWSRVCLLFQDSGNLADSGNYGDGNFEDICMIKELHFGYDFRNSIRGS